MFTPAGKIIERIQKMLVDDSTETKAEILLHLNAAYFEIASLHPWNALTRQVTLATAILPADLVTILYAEDDTDYLYFSRGFPQRYGSLALYNYFSDLVNTTPLVSGDDLVVTANSTTITSASDAAFTSAHVGEYIVIGENEGVYKIASVSSGTTAVLADAFRGDSATAQTFSIRPVGVQRLALTDENGDAITTTTLKLWYLQKPLPLYNDTDRILLPGNCDALRIKTLRLLMESDKYDNDSLKQEGNYENALRAMKNLNPYPLRFIRPRDKLGNSMRFGRIRNQTPYTNRHGEVFL